jgi:hypothetical protein
MIHKTPATGLHLITTMSRNVKIVDKDLVVGSLGLNLGSPRHILSFSTLGPLVSSSRYLERDDEDDDDPTDDRIYHDLFWDPPESFDVGGQVFLRKDIQNISKDVFLLDTWLNAFIGLLRERLHNRRRLNEKQKAMLVLNTQFVPRMMGGDKGVYSYENLWGAKGRLHEEAYLRAVLGGSLNIFEAAAMYVPLNEPHSHWTGVLALFSTKTLVFLDSLQGEPCFRVYAVLLFLRDHWRRLKRDGVLPEDAEDFDVSSWTIEVARIKPGEKQIDTINCLVFQCAYIEQICEGSDIAIAPGSIANGRLRLLVELYKRKTSEKE